MNRSTDTLREVTLQYDPGPALSVQTIVDPDTAVRIFRQVWANSFSLKESMYVLLLNNAKKVIGYYHVSTGGQTATIVDPADVARSAVLTAASSVILAHNHPDGNLDPSRADISLTNRIQAGLKLLGITLHDHIIITQDSYTSLREQGRL